MNDTNNPQTAEPAAFFTTRWTMVMRARGDEPEARAALSDLSEAYWTPVFRFLHREGRNEDESRELAQEFFARLLSRGGIEKVDPEKGRFRSYLLGALKHFLSDRKRAEGRQKRGGDAVVESIDSGGPETSPGMQLPDPSAAVPDAYFDHQWALAVMERGLQTVQSDFEEGGKGKQFELLKPWLIGDTENLSQGEAAEELGISTGAVKVAVHRLRQRFREAIQSEITQTVDSPEEVSAELRYLIEALHPQPVGSPGSMSEMRRGGDR